LSRRQIGKALSAPEKLQHFFSALVEWKTAQKPFALALLRIWYLDDNALLRQQLRETRVKRFTQLLEVILRQGRKDGNMTPSYPDQTMGSPFQKDCYSLVFMLSLH
jgi:hypothetical protein